MKKNLYSHGYSKAEVQHKMSQLVQKINDQPASPPSKAEEKDRPTKDERLERFHHELDLLNNKHYDNYDSSENESSSKLKVESRPEPFPEPAPKREEKEPFEDLDDSPIEWRISRDRLERLAMERDRERSLYRILGARPRRPRSREEVEVAEPIRRIMMRRRELAMETGMREAMGL